MPKVLRNIKQITTSPLKGAFMHLKDQNRVLHRLLRVFRILGGFIFLLRSILKEIITYFYTEILWIRLVSLHLYASYLGFKEQYLSLYCIQE